MDDSQQTGQVLPAEMDVLLVGAGIMSATLGTLLQVLHPGLRIGVVEAAAAAATESSDAWNNAGTGHAALCELNYTPEQADGSVAIGRAVKINEQFRQSLEFWAALVRMGLLPEPRRFVTGVPHMSFVSGAAAVEFLRRRHAALSAHPLFAGMQFSADRAQLTEWMPLMMAGRDAQEPVAATRSCAGTDVDFGALTRELLGGMASHGAAVVTGARVQSLTQLPDRRWYVAVRSAAGIERVSAKFVFLGAGGGALSLLQKAGVPEGRGYGGFPVSGQWLRCVNRDVIERHGAKVYGKPALGAPPMSVPHLDTRWIGGTRELLFGPFAGFSTKFLKGGSYADLFRSLGTENLVPMLGAGATNLPLTKYLIGQVMMSQRARVQELRAFVPAAADADWRLEVAGQRVQIIKRDAKTGGKLEFGTEMIRSADGSLAALLGASPGASTAVSAMLELLEQGIAGVDRAAVAGERLHGLVSTFHPTGPEQFTAADHASRQVLGLAT